MNKNNEIKRGQTISFRIPSETPDYILKELQHLKEKERRNFSSKIAEFVLKGVNEGTSKEQETITIPLPKRLTKAQRNWIKHEHSEALLGSIMYHLLNDPVRSTSLLASMNSNATNIDEALYLQEEMLEESEQQEPELENETTRTKVNHKELDDDLDAIDWNEALSQTRDSEEAEELEEEDLDDLLGDFLSKMNK